MLKNDPTPRPGLFVRLSGLAVLLCAMGPVRAQNKITSVTDLDKDFRNHRELMQKLWKAEIAATPTDKAQQDAVDFNARFLIHRFASPNFHEVGGTDATKTITRLYTDFDQQVSQITNSKDKEKVKELARMFGLKVIEHARLVLDDEEVNRGMKKPLIHVNMARILARSADLGQPELADALADILKDPKYDEAVKYFALQGLRKLLAQPITPPVLTEERALKVVPVLMELVTRKMTITPATPPDEIEGFRYFRREAIRALAQVRLPALSNKERPAMVLFQVMSHEEFTPPTRLDERLEAAIGLAKMRPDKDKDYQSDYAVQQIALFLDEFVRFYNGDNEKERRPCQTMASRLLDALDGLKTDTKDPYVTSLVDNAKGFRPLLEKMEKGTSGVNGPNQNDLLNLVAASPPASNQLFKSVPNAKVKAPEAKAPEAKGPERKD